MTTSQISTIKYDIRVINNNDNILINNSLAYSRELNMFLEPAFSDNAYYYFIIPVWMNKCI